MNTEKKIAYLNEKYGTDISSRVLKLLEEVGEFVCAFKWSDQMRNKNEVLNVLDELADVNAVLFHINALCGKTHEEFVSVAFDKIMKRESNPEYKRTHEHKEFCCDDCPLPNAGNKSFCNK